MDGDWVPTEPLRLAVLAAVEGGETYSGICRRLGWTRSQRDGRVYGDVSRLKRRVGLAAYHSYPARGKGYYSRCADRMRYEIAVEIAGALGRAPVELGL
jgi:hypothetical protein